ncbi:hypothetical protein [Methylocella silvestris]|uniref:Uncharacterized protein n=1 Tax=Methylocella silvestris TaxID=199596 RepID=A0A2J7TCW1_METSI|nr:hypothetical protein [Methylocella silvestris]PNG24610.1 hypothetical protein CR492_17910 [Methylocella silvestris]
MANRTSGLAAALALAAAAIGGGPAASARPLVPSEYRYEPFNSNLPACADPEPLGEIRTTFREREQQYWRTGLDIVAFEVVQETGFRSNGLDYIPRRYCEARIAMSDSKVRLLSYSISQSLGPIGFGFGVEWCVSGLDRFNANAPNCKMARP